MSYRELNATPTLSSIFAITTGIHFQFPVIFSVYWFIHTDVCFLAYTYISILHVLVVKGWQFHCCFFQSVFFRKEEKNHKWKKKSISNQEIKVTGCCFCDYLSVNTSLLLYIYCESTNVGLVQPFCACRLCGEMTAVYGFAEVVTARERNW